MCGSSTSRTTRPIIEPRGSRSVRKAQSAFEYLTIIGIAMALILPGLYFFYSKGEAASDEISLQRLAQMGNDVVNAAAYIYPFGSGSKTTVEFVMPIGVSNITVRGQGNPTGTEFVINLDVRGSNHSLVYFSKYPLFIGNCTSVMPLPSDFVRSAGRKTFQIISCGANVSIYQKQ